MTAAVLQERQTSGSASVTSESLAFVSNVTAGSALHALATAGDNTTYTFSDNNGWSTTPAADTVYDSPSNQGAAHAGVSNHAGGATTVTCTFGASVPFPGIWIREIGGVSASAIDGHNATVGYGVTSQSVSATNANQPAFISALGVNPNQAAVPAASAPLVTDVSGWGWDTTPDGAISAHLRVTTAGTQTATFTESTSTSLMALMMIFDEATVSPTPQPQQMMLGVGN